MVLCNLNAEFATEMSHVGNENTDCRPNVVNCRKKYRRG